jgi:hypothetical protein
MSILQIVGLSICIIVPSVIVLACVIVGKSAKDG